MADKAWKLRFLLVRQLTRHLLLFIKRWFFRFESFDPIQSSNFEKKCSDRLTVLMPVCHNGMRLWDCGAFSSYLVDKFGIRLLFGINVTTVPIIWFVLQQIPVKIWVWKRISETWSASVVCVKFFFRLGILSLLPIWKDFDRIVASIKRLCDGRRASKITLGVPIKGTLCKNVRIWVLLF
jgi:hypothetical protein